MVARALVVLSLLASLALPAPASAALDFQSCDLPWECATLRVPLDRSGEVPGSIDLHVERIEPQSGRPADGALIALAGGPGQAATTLTQDFNNYLFPALDTRDLIVFDQRGTGKSGLLECESLQNAALTDAGDEAAECAEQLGPRRAFYTARDVVADIEALRQALEVDRISLYGVSYGVKLVLAYAATHPTHVERLVLDSVLKVSGPDPFYLDSTSALPRILGELCRGRCGRITDDPVADLASVVDSMGGKALRARAVNGRGKSRNARITGADLFDTLKLGDLFPIARSDVPAALASAARGDTALLGRMFFRPKSTGDDPVLTPASELSQAVFAAATCEETSLPWDRSTPVGERMEQARARAALLPGSAFEPFDAETALGSDVVRLCERWPNREEELTVPEGPFPDVPVLIMNGRNDMRTPLEGAQEVADLFPQSTLVTDRVGHSVLFTSECAKRSLEPFFGDREPGRCKRAKRVELHELPPRSLDGLAPLGEEGKEGRTLRALEATLGDLAPRLDGELLFFDEPARGGGLRGGWVKRTQRVRLGGYVYVPGVAVTGTLTGRQGQFTLSGWAGSHGHVVVRRSRLTGRLDGRPVSARLRLPSLGG